MLPWASCTCLRAHAVPSWHRPACRPLPLAACSPGAKPRQGCLALPGPEHALLGRVRASVRAQQASAAARPKRRVPERLALRRRALPALLAAHRLGERRVPRAAHRGATTGEHIDDVTGEVGEPGYIEDEEPPLHAASPDPPLRPLASPDRPARSTGGPVRCRHASSRHELGGAAEAAAGHGRC
ncbi:hypothetical protein C2845_PM02G17060 [Panicum miliaceum]|uniref:Uncharacterized protein n=1 Tax=Panicum miliaceum TaxID=4540 RepID=A0A3L6S669_PANMI|nr:hypothetical protein C2845_PM02G17060 [Panicum miliaceum]